MPYIDAASQTVLRGLVHHPSSAPAILLPTNTATPPEEYMESKHTEYSGVPKIVETQPNCLSMSRTMSKRKNRPDLVARISLPASDMEDPRSPPPTQAVLSPLPPMNKLHAGHTPLMPIAMSPVQDIIHTGQSTPTPVQEEFLSGPLTLPLEPGDGAADTIKLKVLTAELEKIAREQEFGCEDIETKANGGANVEGSLIRSRKGSAESSDITSPGTIEVDGVILKKPVMNFGAPLGQVSSN
ncbi:hypothetical protein GQ43DRAFT_403042 [Delitschia confertaspora ATCC 74209]|uniref:Uncharacterized protein n=1 Tax=Delitschia confertaspora ATCC 74209 TaxID=1513339 RepID=A0A9P4JGB6_9PLEO|nr:hypothetical protein GQ43DRAFT_403042 [Delitschia confertaspora ATCC 74209]